MQIVEWWYYSANGGAELPVLLCLANDTVAHPFVSSLRVGSSSDDAVTQCREAFCFAVLQKCLYMCTFILTVAAVCFLMLESD